MTFVSPDEGWVLGTVACNQATACLALLHTADGGRTWSAINPPPTGFRQAGLADGVSEVRFANSEDGWAFDPGLWSTRDGGLTWSRVALPGVPADAVVWSLETASGEVVAVVLDPVTYVVKIETSAVGSTVWHLSPTSIPAGAGPLPQAQLVLQGSSGWVLLDNRTVIGGARLVNGHWTPWQPPCLGSNGPAYIAASTAEDLYAVCDEGEWGPPMPPKPRAFVSTDGGASFEPLSSTPATITGWALATPVPSVMVVNSNAGLLATSDGGQTWRGVYLAPADTGVEYVGFETESQGVAISVNDSGSSPVGALLMTVDGGRQWQTVRL